MVYVEKCTNVNKIIGRLKIIIIACNYENFVLPWSFIWYIIYYGSVSRLAFFIYWRFIWQFMLSYDHFTPDLDGSSSYIIVAYLKVFLKTSAQIFWHSMFSGYAAGEINKKLVNPEKISEEICE